MVEVKSEKVHGESEKTLGLFDDNSYREDEIFLSGTSDSYEIYQPINLFILALISTLLVNFYQFSQTLSLSCILNNFDVTRKPENMFIFKANSQDVKIISIILSILPLILIVMVVSNSITKNIILLQIIF